MVVKIFLEIKSKSAVKLRNLKDSFVVGDDNNFFFFRNVMCNFYHFSTPHDRFTVENLYVYHITIKI